MCPHEKATMKTVQQTGLQNGTIRPITSELERPKITTGRVAPVLLFFLVSRTLFLEAIFHLPIKAYQNSTPV